MTAYSCSATLLFGAITAPQFLTVQPSAFEIKIARVEIGINSSLPPAGSHYIGYVDLYRYAGGSTSGGTVVTSPPMRQGGPAATATVRSGGSISGTSSFYTRLMGEGPLASQTYEFPYDHTVAPGSAFAVRATSNLASGTSPPWVQIFLTVYYEELRLSWHY